MLDFINNANFMQSILLLSDIGGCPTSPLREGEKTFFAWSLLIAAGKKRPHLKKAQAFTLYLYPQK